MPLYRYPDMTAQLEALFAFIRQTVLQNHGKLSKAKRESTFSVLRDDEIERLERCVTDGYRSAGTDRAADD